MLPKLAGRQPRPGSTDCLPHLPPSAGSSRTLPCPLRSSVPAISTSTAGTSWTTWSFPPEQRYPGFGPTGPALVTLDELPDRDNIAIECLLNGESVQAARTSEMIFSVPELVEFISGVCPLHPGDLIFTGTLAGVGNRRVPQRFLSHGDVLVSRIDGLGEMRQTFR
ncbi:fumarylacetoacetate hydrolase family protein [Streptomyces sp. NPDC048527]|uniref:fumarylacetoacetate hydrolase family protein n=1 Tax=Streptomyces sp. NPDC048527 TaxID=3365568 RepID=UPI0037185582